MVENNIATGFEGFGNVNDDKGFFNQLQIPWNYPSKNHIVVYQGIKNLLMVYQSTMILNGQFKEKQNEF